MRRRKREDLKVNVSNEEGKRKRHNVCILFAFAWEEMAKLKLAHGGPVPFYFFLGCDYSQEHSKSSQTLGGFSPSGGCHIFQAGLQ